MKKTFLILLVLLGLQTQAQNWCDSVSYTAEHIFPLHPLTVNGNTSGMGWTDSIKWYWQVCNSTTCYGDTGQTVIFHDILSTDTIKVCYDAYVHSSFTNTFTCSDCDSLIYDFNSNTWVLFSMSNTFPTSINEITFNKIHDNKMYDLMGREFQSFNSIPVGTIYIQNRKKCLKLAHDGYRVLK